jgi:hypothetical protein
LRRWGRDCLHRRNQHSTVIPSDSFISVGLAEKFDALLLQQFRHHDTAEEDRDDDESRVVTFTAEERNGDGDLQAAGCGHGLEERQV